MRGVWLETVNVTGASWPRVYGIGPRWQERYEVLGIRFKDKAAAEDFRVHFERCQGNSPAAAAAADSPRSIAAGDGRAAPAAATTAATRATAAVSAPSAVGTTTDDDDSEGPLIARRGFWEEEGGGGNPAACCPLLNRNGGFLRDPLAGSGGKERDGAATARAAAELNRAALERAARWPALCGADTLQELPPVRALRPPKRIVARRELIARQSMGKIRNHKVSMWTAVLRWRESGIVPIVHY